MLTKKYISVIPELLLIGMTIYYWSLTALVINPLALVLLALFTFQIISKNTISGILIASVIILLNLYLILALLSELSEFETANSNFKRLLIGGTLFVIVNLTIGGLMLYKYFKKTIKNN